MTETYISVIMPVYNQANFVRCAIQSLIRQTYNDWELIIIDDGSKDKLYETVEEFVLAYENIAYYRNVQNEGLGFSLNKGICLAKGKYIAYLPADDIYFEDHLLSLYEKTEEDNSDFVYSGIIHNIGNHGGERNTQVCEGIINGQTLQLVQVLHRKTEDRWLERKELVTDDLGKMFWDVFMKKYPVISKTKKATCEWFSHMYQRHNILNDRTGGGIYMYKIFYGVKEPLKYHSSVGNLIDEAEHYSHLQKREYKQDKNGLKILLVGELAFNPERILALEDRGHKLYGLWINNPLCYNTVGPLPFGHVEDIPFEGWEQRVKEIKADIIYAMLNFKAVELAHHVQTHNPGIPFVWHFKEGPFFCRTYGLWNKLTDLYSKSDGAVYTNEMIRDWFRLFLDKKPKHELIIDGDLPLGDWLKGKRSKKLSETDGEIHTVIAGRIFGIGSEDIETLANQKIHLHIYGDVNHNSSKSMLDEAAALAPGYVHLHPNCPTEKWVSEFSQYDAGWLHYFQSYNNGDLMRANWADINSPARMSTYAIAGLPMIMHDNIGHAVHHQKYLETLGMALPISNFEKAGEVLNNRNIIKKAQTNAWQNRERFCFDFYADELIKMFREIISEFNNQAL